MDTLLCRWLGHWRDVRHARLTDKGWRCQCRRCGEQLLRIAPKRWLPLAEAELLVGPPPPEPLPLFEWNS